VTVSDPLSERREAPVPGRQAPVRALGPRDRRPGDEVGLLRIVSILLKRWRAVVFLPLTAGFATAAISFAVPQTFVATTSFVPEVRSSARISGGFADLAGLASQFGVSLGSDGSQSPRFYADVAESRAILQPLLLSRFATPGRSTTAGDSTTLLQALGVGGKNLADSLERGLKKLRGRVAVKVDNPTNVVTVSVEARSAGLAANVANRLVTYLNAFNAQVRQSHARARRQFVEQRVSEGDKELKNAEADLRTFYERNRSWQQAPQLVFEEGRLRRQVELSQNLYLTLRREYETARIEEVNDIPVITVIDVAVPPQRRAWPKRTLLVILALVLGGLTATIWAFVADFVERARTEGEHDYMEFAETLTRVRDDFSHLVRRATGRAESRRTYPPS
jgi:uncharacterized protein involved in exopolysaccharide biosynthesis